MKPVKFLAFLLFIGVAFLFSCSEEEENVIGAEENSAAADEAFAESYFEEVDDLAYNASAAEGGRVAADERLQCAAVLLQNDTLTIDFGEGCTGPRGRVRAGKIVVTRTAPYFETGTTITTILEGFSIDGNDIKGTRVLKNLGINEDGHHKFRVTLTGGHISFNNGIEISRTSDFTRTWVRGANVLLDEMHIAGTAGGTNRKGVSYEMNILEPLVYKVSCRSQGYPIAVQGIKTITSEGKQLTVNFGDGACDNEITLSMNGFSKSVTLGSGK